MKPLRVILIGLGRMGRNHLRVLRDSTRLSIVGVVDTAFDGKNPMEKLADLPCWASLDECLQGTHFDAAVIASPTPSHFEVAEKLILAGKHLLVEKPLCTTYAESLELLKLSEQRHTILKVAHLERLNPGVRKLKEVIDSSLLGEPIHFSFTRVGGYPLNSSASNNVLMDLAVHDIDVLHYLVGCEPGFSLVGSVLHSTAQPQVVDTAEVLLENPRSISASIHVNWVTPSKIRTVRVTGTLGVCMVDYILQTCVLHAGNLLKNRAEPKVGFEELVKLYSNSDRIEFGVDRQEPLKVQLAEFEKTLDGEESELCGAREGALAVDLAERALCRRKKAKVSEAA